MIKPIGWTDDAVVLLDQRLLPGREVYLELRTVDEVAAAIRDLVVRGAPAIGVTAALALAMEADQLPDDPDEFLRGLAEAGDRLTAARPTAVNLSWAVGRIRRLAARTIADGVERVRERLREESRLMYHQDIEINRALGRHGAALVPVAGRVLTHCNAGALATAGYGTALGVVRAAFEGGNAVSVLADETRPFWQGARLTAWEMQHDGIPCTVITDSMAGHLMQRGDIDVVIVGADRIAANGDVANKIGTYSVAVLAREHGIPFYVAAPTSTIDLQVASGAEIPIEQRNGDEVVIVNHQRIAPAGVGAAYPAFDVTPSRLVTAIITEHGVVRAPFEEGLAGVCLAGASAE
jgi:methylthioribose-1-phosphate isomerase